MKNLKIAIAVGAVLLLTACGGGGSSGTPAVFTPRSDPCDSLTKCPANNAQRTPGALTKSEYVGDSLGTPATAPNEYDVRYRATNGRVYTDHHLDNINAADAYAAGWTGRGETIAVFDTGVRQTHREFNNQFAGSGNKVTVRTLPTNPLFGYRPNNRQKYHGTAVASIAAGNRNGDPAGVGFKMQGVAFDANIHFTQIELGNPPPPGAFQYSPLPTVRDDQSFANFYSALINPAYAAGARIANLSFGLNGSISYFRNRYGDALLRQRFARVAGVLEQSGRAADEKMIIVWAAGNGGSHSFADDSRPDFSSSSVLDGLGVIFPELRGHVITVVALDQDVAGPLSRGGTQVRIPRIASYSNRCGIAKAFCLAAPGSRILLAGSNNDSDYDVGSGTSFAAPVVSGALAILRQRFRNQLGNSEIVSRLLATADRTGIYRNSDIYGHGKLDLAAAIRPFGTVQVNGIPFAQNSITPGAPFGDAIHRAFAGNQIAGFDSLNAPFLYPLSGFVKPQNAPTLASLQQLHRALPLSHRQQNYLGAGGFAFHPTGVGEDGDNGWQLGAMRAINADSASHLHLASGGHRLNVRNRPGVVLSAFASETKTVGTPQVAGATFAWQPHQKASNNIARDFQLGFGGGYLSEADRVLAGEGSGTFGNLSSQTLFLAVGGRRTFNQWELNGGAEVGAVFTDGGFVFDEVSRVFTSSFSLVAEPLLFERNKIRFSLSSPLRIEQGNGKITVPISRNTQGDIIRKQTNLSLRPSGRQLDATATWQHKLPIGNFALTTRVSHQPNHTADAKADISTLASYRLEF